MSLRREVQSLRMEIEALKQDAVLRPSRTYVDREISRLDRDRRRRLDVVKSGIADLRQEMFNAFNEIAVLKTNYIGDINSIDSDLEVINDKVDLMLENQGLEVVTVKEHSKLVAKEEK